MIPVRLLLAAYLRKKIKADRLFMEGGSRMAFLIVNKNFDKREYFLSDYFK